MLLYVQREFEKSFAPEECVCHLFAVVILVSLTDF